MVKLIVIIGLFYSCYMDSRSGESSFKEMAVVAIDSQQIRDKITALVEMTASSSYDIKTIQKTVFQKDTSFKVRLDLVAYNSGWGYSAFFDTQYKITDFMQNGMSLMGEQVGRIKTGPTLDSLLHVCKKANEIIQSPMFALEKCIEYKEFYWLCFESMSKKELSKYPIEKPDGTIIDILDPYVNFLISKHNLQFLGFFMGA